MALRGFSPNLVCTSNESAGLGQSAAASPISIALTVLEKQLTRVTVSGASSCSYTCMNFSLLDELILENSYTHVSRHVRKFYDTGDGSAYCSSIPSMFISFTFHTAACITYTPQVSFPPKAW